uniref:Uncharacterized protein n=1 Tax=Serratia marcescens TaxID=615 RepID=A0A1C3HH08_SERMA|nr:Uncharacterised protein [Serratia marcescens]
MVSRLKQKIISDPIRVDKEMKISELPSAENSLIDDLLVISQNDDDGLLRTKKISMSLLTKSLVSERDGNLVSLVDGFKLFADKGVLDTAASRAEAAAEIAQNIADANTYYITPEDPDGTIAGIAGTPNGQSFRVAQGPDKGFKYYRNDSGVAIEIAAVAGEAAIAAVIAAQAFLNSIFPQSLSIAAAGWMWGASNIDGTALFAGIDSTGGLQLCDMPDAVQDRLRALGDYETTSRTPGYHHVFKDAAGGSGAALRDDWGLMLAGLDGAVQDEINDLKIGTGSAILRPHNGLLAVFKDADSTTPVYAVNPVAYAAKLAAGGASIVYDDAGAVSTGTLNLREPQPQNSTKWGYVQRPIPSFVSHVMFRQGLGQSLMVGGGDRVTPVDIEFLGQALTFMGAGADRGVGYPDDGAVTDENLSVFMDARSIGEFRENCMVPGMLRFLHDMTGVYGADKRQLPAVVSRMDAKSGTSYAGLKKGTSVYNDGQAAFTSFVERVLEQGKIPVINSFFITHGEEDSKTVTTVGQYQASLNEWVNDKQADTLAVLAAHGVTQADKPLAYIDQVGSIGKTATKRGDLIAYAQLAISNERPDVILSTPKFHLNRKYHIDDLHLTGQGYAVMGEYQGQSEAFMYKERVAGTNNKWIPVQPLSVVKNGLNYDVTYSSPLGLPLKVNTKYGTAPNLGADLENGSANVTSANQISDFVFRFTLDAEPAAGEFLRFGFNATDATYCLVCISDTSSRVSRSDPTFVMENFCCLSRIAIS